MGYLLVKKIKDHFDSIKKNLPVSNLICLIRTTLCLKLIHLSSLQVFPFGQNCTIRLQSSLWGLQTIQVPELYQKYAVPYPTCFADPDQIDSDPDPASNVRGGLFWIFFFFLCYVIQHCFICRPSDSTVSEDADLDPGLLWLRHWQPDALTTRLDLIHSQLDLIHDSARSHPRLG